MAQTSDFIRECVIARLFEIEDHGTGIVLVAGRLRHVEHGEHLLEAVVVEAAEPLVDEQRAEVEATGLLAHGVRERTAADHAGWYDQWQRGFPDLLNRVQIRTRAIPTGQPANTANVWLITA